MVVKGKRIEHQRRRVRWVICFSNLLADLPAPLDRSQSHGVSPTVGGARDEGRPKEKQEF